MAVGGLQAVGEALSAYVPGADARQLIDEIRVLEQLRSLVAARQAQAVVAFDAARREQERAAGVRADRRGRSVAVEVGLARRCSPSAAQRFVGWVAIVTAELPATFAQLAAGRTSEWRTVLVARETAVLSRQQRAEVDAAVAGRLEGWGDQRVAAEARRMAYRLDPGAAVARHARAAADRRVTIRPEPDTMVSLRAVLPVAQGVAAYAALCAQADGTTAAGDSRGRGQIMADTLVERVTGQARAAGVPVEVCVLATPGTLAGGSEPAQLVGYGPIPAGVARDLAGITGTATDTDTDTDTDAGITGTESAAATYTVADAGIDGQQAAEVAEVAEAAGEDVSRVATVEVRDTPTGERGPAGDAPAGGVGQLVRWWRGVYLDDAGQIGAADPRRRPFPVARLAFSTGQRRVITLRDQTCRTPWCGAPIRHIDHIQPHHTGGPTTISNGQGLCAACNYAKEAGLTARTTPDGTIQTTTPTGHTYRSRPPDPPGTPGRRPQRTPEIHRTQHIHRIRRIELYLPLDDLRYEHAG